MSFLYPTFLFALSAIVIPIILHLVQLRRAKRVAFSNVKFIKASQDVTASQRKLKDILILISRILFVTFLVLAFAQPFIPAQENISSANNSSVALVIDNSFSMQNRYEGSDMSLLDAAIQKSKGVIDIFQANTGFYVYANSGNLNKGLLTTSQDAISLASQLTYSAQYLNLPKQLSFSHMFLMSDMQESTFNIDEVYQVDSATQVHIIPIEAAEHINVFVDTLFLQDEFLRVGTENTLIVRFYNAGEEEVKDCPVKLFINDRQVASLSLDLAPKQSTETTINFNLTEDETSLASIYLEDYPVEFDNSYYFVLAPSGGIDITEVIGSDNTVLSQVYKGEPLLRHNAFKSGNIDYARASDSDLLVLNAIENMNSGLITTVSNFVKGGGTVLIIPAPEGSSSSYSALFNTLGISAQLASANTAGKAGLLVPDASNPFFRNIFAEFDRSMQMPTATRKLVWSRASEDILKFRGGAPFLSVFKKGKGSVYLMASPLDEEFSNLVNHGLFVPVMYKIAIAGYKQEQELAYDLNTSTISVPVAQTGRREGIFKLEKDSLEFIPDQQVRGGNLYFTIPPALNDAGFYQLTYRDSVVSEFAFNYPKNESLLESYTPEQLRALIGNNRKNIHVYDYGDAFSVKSEFEKQFFGVKLWKYCLILCLVFLMAEIALIRFL